MDFNKIHNIEMNILALINKILEWHAIERILLLLVSYTNPTMTVSFSCQNLSNLICSFIIFADPFIGMFLNDEVQTMNVGLQPSEVIHQASEEHIGKLFLL
jgi:hypothetical protein